MLDYSTESLQLSLVAKSLVACAFLTIFGFMDINPTYNKTPLVIGLMLAAAAVSTSGLIFINCVEYYGTDMQWKFYCSLAGFSIFFLLFCFLLAANVIAYRKVK